MPSSVKVNPPIPVPGIQCHFSLLNSACPHKRSFTLQLRLPSNGPIDLLNLFALVRIRLQICKFAIPEGAIFQGQQEEHDKPCHDGSHQ